MLDLATLPLEKLRSPKEDTRYGMALFFAVTSWLGLCLMLLPIFFAAVAGLALLIAQALFLAGVRGNGVKLSPQQLPHIHERVVAAAKRLGLKDVPEAYIMESGGILNAFAAKFLGRKFIIIYADLVEAAEDDPKALDFVIGHEMGHLALGHLTRRLWLFPAQLVPLLGAALARAEEYSCDRCGLAVAQDLAAASRGLAMLAAGKSLPRQMSLDAFVTQRQDANGFWAAVYELSSTHPFLPKRVAALREFVQPGTAPELARTVLAYPFAPFLGGGAAGVTNAVLLPIFVIGLLAAIAIPNFMRYQARAKQTEAKQLLATCRSAEQAYFAEHKVYAPSLIELAIDTSNQPRHYTLYLGDYRFGDERELPNDEYLGYTGDKGFACYTVGNIDDDEALDVWRVTHETPAPVQVEDDLQPR